MNSLKAKFGKRIKELRKRSGFTQEKLVEMIDMEPPNISKMENGLHFPQPENIEKLAKVFDIDVKSLFDFEHFEAHDLLIKRIHDYLEKADDKSIEFVYKCMTNLKEYRK